MIRLEARPKNIEGFGEVTIKDLVINALRMRPDRIVVGECRGSEALDMLQAMNTGHDGSLTTLHANAPKEAISRLTTMVRYGVDLPVEVIELADRRSPRSGRSNEPRSGRQTLHHRDRRLLLQRSGKALRDEELFQARLLA